MKTSRRFSHFPHRGPQRGLVLIVALLVLVVTVLAAVALVRTVDVATLISGNLAYRQAAIQATDTGVEKATHDLIATSLDNLNTDIAPWYYATRNGGVALGHAFDPGDTTWRDFWADANAGVLYTELTPADAQGNKVRYAVHRMCEDPLEAPKANCFSASGVTAEGISNRIKEPGDLPCFDPNTGINRCAPVNPYYRITVMVTGPRGTETFAQAVIY